MKKISRLLTVSVLSTMMISGCSSTSDVVDRERQVAEDRAELVSEREERENERLEERLDEVPRWVLETPRPDATGVYAVGIGESKKLRTSLNSARLQGEFGLAKVYKQELSGQERAYEQDNGGEEVSEQYTALIDKLVERVPVVGYEVVEQETQVIQGKYSTYVLVKLPFEQFNNVLREQRRLAKDDTIINAFNDLEKRLDKRREQLREDDATSHEREVDAKELAAEHEFRNEQLKIERLKVKESVKSTPEASGK